MGHTQVWDYSLNQIRAFVSIANRRRDREKADDITMGVLANRGEPTAVKKAIKDLTQ